MNEGVTASGSPNQNGSTPVSPMPALATSRICEAINARTAGRAEAVIGEAESFMRKATECGGMLKAWRWKPSA